MNNEYIFTPTLDIDLEKIKEITLRRLNMPVEGLASHQRLVEDEPYLVELRERYPFLSQVYNIYPTNPNVVVPIHVCTQRGCGLNFPVKYTEDSHTIFYRVKDGIDASSAGKPGGISVHNEERVYQTYHDDHMEEVYRYTLTEPTLMNTKIPHGVISGPNEQRVIMSWSTPVTFAVAKVLLGG